MRSRALVLFALAAGACGAPVTSSDTGPVEEHDAGVHASDAGVHASDAGVHASDAGPSVDASVDDDGDGLDDDDELALATAYLPFLSNHPDDACPRSGIVFRARPHPVDASFVHVIYSRLYELDCGLTSHPGDNEVFSLTIDPTRAPPEGIVAVRAISHQSTICERDTICGACPGLSPCDTASLGGLAFPVVYASKDKHASVVDIGAGCSLTSCLDRCELAVTTTIVPLAAVDRRPQRSRARRLHHRCQRLDRRELASLRPVERPRVRLRRDRARRPRGRCVRHPDLPLTSLQSLAPASICADGDAHSRRIAPRESELVLRRAGRPLRRRLGAPANRAQRAVGCVHIS